MKAKEYFEKYFTELDGLSTEEVNEIVVAFINELSMEVVDICDMRHSRTNSSTEGALKEQNNKFNAVGNLIEKKYGRPLFKRNGFIQYWQEQFRIGGLI